MIGTSVRINEMTADNGVVRLSIRGASDFSAFIRIKTPFAVQRAELDGEPVAYSYDPDSKTALVSFPGKTGDRTLTLIG